MAGEKEEKGEKEKGFFPPPIELIAKEKERREKKMTRKERGRSFRDQVQNLKYWVGGRTKKKKKKRGEKKRRKPKRKGNLFQKGRKKKKKKKKTPKEGRGCDFGVFLHPRGKRGGKFGGKEGEI